MVRLPPQPLIRIGVHVTDASQYVGATLRALLESTAKPHETMLLVDPEPADLDAVIRLCAAFHGIAQAHIRAPGGGPEAFNRLIAEPADIYVFLEAGARPGPDWLSHLLTALAADPSNGIAGPSTNRCWTEQGIASNCGDRGTDISQRAQRLAQYHAGAWQSLTPLHNLADFCLVVSRQVVTAIGAADTAYGRGPCWEMDYNIRAARAGFRGVWAKAAFVYRPPLPTSRLAAERALIESNKHLYQDRFCGQRAAGAGKKMPYHAHCRGEACREFAPVATTQVFLPPATSEPPVTPRERPTPLVSCIMPTRGRSRFVAQSIVYFRRQDYPNRELVIVYESDDDIPDGIEGADVRLVRSTESNIGSKRNEAVRAARGEILMHWDDDDWFAPGRLSRQVQPILDGIADVTGLNGFLFMALSSGEFWSVAPDLFARMFVENISGGTLAYRRAVWERSGPYPSISLREDAEFLIRAMRDGATLCRLPGHDVHIYLRHGRNAWTFPAGRYLEPKGWSRAPEPDCLAGDRAFYLDRPAAPATITPPPFVSCIMPTADRRAFVGRAIGQFLAQDYLERELIVIDDGQDSVADLIPKMDRVRYHRIDKRLPLGAKRNLGCDMARGPIIAHWDDDDWIGPQWLSSQVETLTSYDADICGLDRVFFYAPATRQAWRYVYDGRRPWVCGGTMCYRKALWQITPFREINVGEDNGFVWGAQTQRVSVNTRADLYIAFVHQQNTSPKITTGRYWQSIPATYLERLMRDGVTHPLASDAAGG